VRLGDVDLLESEAERRMLIEELNATSRPFPADLTVGELFARQAARTPDAEAVVDADGRRSYAELLRDVEGLAAYLVARGVGPEVHVGVLLRRSYRMVVALLATLRAGGVYVPLNPDLPLSRLRALVDDVGAPLVVCERALIGQANALQWECASVATMMCLDSPDVHAELERSGPRMDPALWDLVAARARDPIEAGGWRSAHSGEVLSEAAMMSFVEGVVRAVSPLLPAEARLLEIGCGSGITLAGLAPLAGRYVAIDISAQALEWAQRTCDERGLEHVSLCLLDALELERLPPLDAGPFDAAVLNSVVQSFSGFNHLREVIGQTIERVRDDGFVFLGHVWDPERREALPLERQLDALFVPRAFFEDLRFALPRLASVELCPMGCDAPEIAAYGYDVLLHVGRAPMLAPSCEEPRKRQEDRRALGFSPVGSSADRHRPDAGAYVIQTSGSTGHARAVQVEMRALVNLLWWYRDVCDIDVESRVAQVITCGFDASVKNFLAPLIGGGTLVLLEDGPYDPAALLAMIEREAVTVLNPGVPAMAYPLVELSAADGWAQLRSLRCLALGGEAPDLARLREWLASEACAARVLNIYGPTECTDIACWHELTAAEVAGSAPLSVGRPIHNVQAYVLGRHLAPEPIGVVGELYISGAGLARGYVGSPELTAERFPKHPLRPGERIYRTGDLARRLPNGDIVLHGRADTQVKVRGHRIELTEVERALGALDGVREAAAVAVGDGAERRLVGYVLADDLFDERLAGEVLRNTLPAAVVPERIVRLDYWPLNAHGKLDRHALPAADAKRPAGRLPCTPLERAIAAVWRDVLRLDREVGANEGFFEAGGDSLAAALLVQRMRERSLEMSLTDVYREQTVAGQATLLESHEEDNGMLHVLGNGSRPPLFCFPPIAGFAWTFAELARRLEGFSVRAFDFSDVHDPAAACAEAILAAMGARSSCLLAGYSAGGLLAAATASELERRGAEVAGVVLFDAAPPQLRERFPPAAAQAVAEEVAADGRLAAHVAHVGRERLRRVVVAYMSWYNRAPAPAPLAADLLAVTAEGADGAWAEGWRAASSGELTVVQGCGSHDELLSAGNVAVNATLVSSWLSAHVRD
jgi:amino acid adenylation domain-containing protein